MKIERNVDLGKYSSMGIGGTAKEMYFPENLEDLVEVHNSTQYVIACGSNILINDRIYDKVLNLSALHSEVNDLGKGEFYFGAAFRTPKMVRYINNEGYGGVEYLACVPGTIGGAIYMNAGRGAHTGQFISNYLVEVEALIDGKVVTLTKEECRFKFRYSIFHEKKWIILGARFIFPEVEKEQGKALIDDRVKYCKMNQDHSGGNLGSVFCMANGMILEVVKRVSLGKRKGVRFSKKTSNWIINNGNGTFKEALRIIRIVEMLHTLMRYEIRREIVIWK